jgi:uncharacterized protein
MQSTVLTPLGALTDDERCSLREAQHLAGLRAALVAVPDPRGWAVSTTTRPRAGTSPIGDTDHPFCLRWSRAARILHCGLAFGGGFPPSVCPLRPASHAMARELNGPATAPARPDRRIDVGMRRPLRHIFVPPDKNFMGYLVQQVKLVQEGLKVLADFMDRGDFVLVDALRAVEREGDEMRRVLVEELNGTFVTPIDREDLHALSRALDDLLDYGYRTIKEMAVYKLEPNTYLRRMVALLQDMARELEDAVAEMLRHPTVASDHAVRAKTLENRMEDLYHEAVADLLESDDIKYIIKLREIYRHLSNSADRGDRAADVLLDIVVKQA